MYHWRKIAVVVAGLAVSGPAQAQAVLDVFGGEGACYSREYNKAHLASHPGQRVEKIALWSTEEDPRSDEQVLRLYFALRDGFDYSGYSYCSNASCQMEADGGNFKLSRAGDRLKLTVGNNLNIEGVENFSGNLADSDDQEFLLNEVRLADCN